MEYPQDHQAEQRRSIQRRFLHQKGQAHDGTHRGPPEDRADAVPVGHLVDHEHPGVGQPGQQGQHIPQHPARRQAVHKEEHHTPQHKHAGDQVQPSGPLPQKEDREQNDEDGGGEL